MPLYVIVIDCPRRGFVQSHLISLNFWKQLIISRKLYKIQILLEKLPSIEDRRQTDRVTSPTRAGLRLPLASAAPRRTPRRASSQLKTSQWKPTVSAHRTPLWRFVRHTFFHWRLNFDRDIITTLTFYPSQPMVMAHARAKNKDQSHSKVS